MDKNNFFYDKLKHNDSVQKFLKNADSMISCSKCSNNISDSNYCSKCGKNSIVVTKVNTNYLSTFMETSQKYTQITNLKKNIIVDWTKSKLEQFNIFISDEPVYSRSKYHKFILNCLRFLSILTLINLILLNINHFEPLRLILSVGQFYFLSSLIVSVHSLTNDIYFKNSILLFYLSIIELLLSFIVPSSYRGWSLLISTLFLLLIILPSDKVVSIFEKFSLLNNEKVENFMQKETSAEYNVNSFIESATVFTSKTSMLGGFVKFLLSVIVLAGLVLGGVFYTSHSADGNYSFGVKGTAELKLNIIFVHVDGEILVLGKSQKFKGSVDWINQTIEIKLPVSVPGIGDKISGTYEKDEQGNLKIGVDGVNQLQLKRN